MTFWSILYPKYTPKYASYGKNTLGQKSFQTSQKTKIRRLEVKIMHSIQENSNFLWHAKKRFFRFFVKFRFFMFVPDVCITKRIIIFPTISKNKSRRFIWWVYQLFWTHRDKIRNLRNPQAKQALLVLIWAIFGTSSKCCIENDKI